jgi:hypothetical protein
MMIIMRSFLLASFVALSAAADGAVISIDSINRMVTSSVSGGTSDVQQSSASGVFQKQASTPNGSDGGTATAFQNTQVLGGEIFSFYSDSDLSVSGSRGSGFAPVSLNSESLVEVNFTIPQEAGVSGFWIGGSYTIVGDSADGSPRVAWSLASTGVGASQIFGRSANSGVGVSLNEIGTIGPGSYELSFNAHVGNRGCPIDR